MSDDSFRPSVLHLGKYYPPAAGGIETHTRVLARAQADLGLPIRVLAVRHDRYTVRSVRQERDGTIALERRGRAACLAKLDVCPGLSRALRRASRDVDIIHLHVPNPTMILALLAARVRRPVVVTYHSDLVRQRVLGRLFRPFEHRAYRHVAAILTTTPIYIEGSPFLKCYRDRVEVVPLGIDLAPYLDPSPEHRRQAEEIRADLSKRGGGPIWLGCGRMVGYKGFDIAVRAMPDVPGVLVLSGKGPERAELETLAKRLGVIDRVVFLDNLPHYLDVVPYHLAATALWCVSRTRAEAFGLAQIEAMATGTPVINTAIPGSGVPWVCPDGVCGLTVPVDDPSAVAQAARTLLDDPDRARLYGEAGRARTIAEFDHRVMARRVLDVYRRILAR